MPTILTIISPTRIITKSLVTILTNILAKSIAIAFVVLTPAKLSVDSIFTILTIISPTKIIIKSLATTLTIIEPII